MYPVSSVIRGAAIIAGSRPTFFATRGRMQPMHFAMMTTEIIVIPRLPQA